MQISSRFTAAVHILTLLNTENEPYLTSESIAASVNTNPVVIRRIEGMLKKAGIVTIERGSKGTCLAKKASEITLLDVYRAVSAVEQDQLFKLHDAPNPSCDIGANIHEAVLKTLESAQNAMESVLNGVTISQVTDTILHNLSDELV